MGCGCGNKTVKSQPVQKVSSQNRKITNVISNNIKSCPKCKSTMIYKQQFVAKLRGYIKLWECPKCNYKIVGR